MKKKLFRLTHSSKYGDHVVVFQSTKSLKEINKLDEVKLAKKLGVEFEPELDEEIEIELVGKVIDIDGKAN